MSSLAERLETMALHLRWSERGVLLVAAAPDRELEQTIAEELKRRVGDDVKVLEFTFAPEPAEKLSLSYHLRTLPPPDGKSALFVYGLDDLPAEDRETAIHSLNWGRERLAWAGYSVVLWVRSQTLGDLMLRAPDFYSWRSGAYEFDLPTDQAARAEALSTLRLFAPAELTELRQRYCDYLVESYRWLDFRGLLQVRNVVRFKLEDIYVSLRATIEEKGDWGELAELRKLRGRDETREEVGAATPSELLGVVFKRSTEHERVELDKALQEHQQLVVLGDPGSGKSTLLKHLALTFAEGRDVARERLGLNEDRLPILLPVSVYAAALREEDLSLTEYLPRHFAEHQLPDLTPLFQHELELGRALVLLDGLDEVLRTRDRLEVARRVEAFARRYRRNRFVVTSRIAGYSAGPLRGDFAHFTIEPFSDDQLRRFAVNWSQAYEATTGWSPQAEQRAERRAKNLVKAINTHSGIRRLATNPLLLTILALIHHQGTRLPHRRVELYRLCVEALAETWNLARSLAEQPIELWVGDRLLDEEQVVRVLAPIAYWMHKEVPSGLVEREALEEQVTRHLARWKGPHEAPRLARQFLELVREQMGLLVERGLDQFGFMHLTFEEYLAARYIADQREAERKALVLEHLHDPRWREAILLAAGSLPTPQATDLVRVIWKAGSPYEDLLHHDLLMAGRCLADDVPVSYNLRHQILNDLFDLWRTTRYAKLREEITDTLATMRGTASQDRVVAELLAALDDESADVRRSAAEVLGRLGLASQEIVTALLVTLEDDSAVVRGDAAEALGQLGQASQEVVAGLLAALEDDSVVVRGGAAEALGELGQASPVVVARLLATLQDDSVSVQWHAVALGQLGQASPQVVAMLLAALQGDSASVRWGAAWTLGQSAQRFSEVIARILTALEDESEDVRWHAAEALGQLGQASPEVAARLLAALQDDSADVRGSAAFALGQLGQASPEVMTRLLAAVEDSSENVRAGAVLALGQLGQASPVVVERLLAALQDDSASVRRGAAWALGQLGQASPPVVATLLVALQDDSEDVRWRAAEALGQLGQASPQVAAELLATLEDDSEDVRWRAAEALGQLGQASSQVVTELLTALESDSENVRGGAAEALGQLGQASSQVVERLLAALQDDEMFVRGSAARALGQLKANGRVIRALLLMLDEEHNEEWVLVGGHYYAPIYDFVFEALWELVETVDSENTDLQDGQVGL